MTKVDYLAAFLTGRTAQRRARVLWRWFVGDPPASAEDLAQELGLSVSTVRMDQLAALDKLHCLRRMGGAIPRSRRGHGCAALCSETALGPSGTSHWRCVGAVPARR